MSEAKHADSDLSAEPIGLDGKQQEIDDLRTPTAENVTGEEDASSLVGPTTASIVQIYGPGLGKRHILEERTVIGRDNSATLEVDLSGVSRRHAELFERDGGWWITDLGSTNGTFVSGVEIRGEILLTSGDVLRLGGAIFKYLAGGDIEALYHEEIYSLTITDGLTGIHNKRHFMELLEREAARSLRRGHSLWVAMLDIDHFKKLNDTHGHVTGDHLLSQIAQLIAAEIRADEAVARYGGEEFVLMFPEAESAEVKTLCERIRGLVEEHDFLFDGERHQMTVSIGASSIRPDQTIEDLVGAADEQLYRAKKEGRNRVLIDGPKSEVEP